jgi:hypothetical protein
MPTLAARVPQEHRVKGYQVPGNGYALLENDYLEPPSAAPPDALRRRVAGEREHSGSGRDKTSRTRPAPKASAANLAATKRPAVRRNKLKHAS